MDDNPKEANTPDKMPPLRHEKVIEPLHAVQPEETARPDSVSNAKVPAENTSVPAPPAAGQTISASSERTNVHATGFSSIPRRHFSKTMIFIACAGGFLILLIIIGTITGYGPYLQETIRCGHRPIVANDLAAAYSYKKPGDTGYDAGGLFSSYYCTESEARAAGYSDNSISPEQNAKNIADLKARKYAPGKVPFKVYTPTYVPSDYVKYATFKDLDGYIRVEDATHGSGKEVDQSFTRTSDHGSIFIRQGEAKLDAPDATCSNSSAKGYSEDRCTEYIRRQQDPETNDACFTVLEQCPAAKLISSDSTDRKVYQVIVYGRTIIMGVVIDGTFVNIEWSNYSELTAKQAIQMLGSMQLVK